MSAFNYPANCTFCATRIGSDKCLLPFKFVSNFIPSENAISAIMEITEIHVSYGIQILQQNLELSNWFPNNQNINNSSAASEQSVSGQFDVIMRTSNRRSTTISYSDKASQSETQDYESSTKSHESGAKISKGKEVNISKDTVKSWADLISESEDQDIKRNKVETDSQKSEESKRSGKQRIELPNTKKELTRDEQNHLIQDLLMSIKCAYNMHQKLRTNTRLDRLLEALNFELSIKSAKGHNYKPNLKSSLDGEIALSKVIVANHSTNQILEWEKGKQSLLNNCCILNHEHFRISNLDSSEIRLEDALLEFQKWMNYTLDYSQVQVTKILNSVAFELQREDMYDAYQWSLNMQRMKSKEGKPVKMVKAKPFIPETPFGPRKKDIPYPPIDERYEQFIEHNLQSIINKQLSLPESEPLTMKDGMKLEKYFFILSSEFIKRNKGWRNSNSFTGPNHLDKLIEYSELYLEKSEAYSVFSILQKILINCREKFKDLNKVSPTED